MAKPQTGKPPTIGSVHSDFRRYLENRPPLESILYDILSDISSHHSTIKTEIEHLRENISGEIPSKHPDNIEESTDKAYRLYIAGLERLTKMYATEMYELISLADKLIRAETE